MMYEGDTRFDTMVKNSMKVPNGSCGDTSSTSQNCQPYSESAASALTSIASQASSLRKRKSSGLMERSMTFGVNKQSGK